MSMGSSMNQVEGQHLGLRYSNNGGLEEKGWLREKDSAAPQG